LIRILEDTYQINEDYIIEKDEFDPEKVFYYITPECFKLICLSGMTKNSEKTRKYFINLEKIIIRFKDEISDLFKHEQEVLKLGYGIYPTKPGIYVIQEVETETHKNNENVFVYIYKLGTTNNLHERMSCIESHEYETLIYFEELLNHELIKNCIKYGLEEYSINSDKNVFECSINNIRDMISTCINFHKYKLSRPATKNTIQIQFTYIKNDFNPNKVIQLTFDDYDLNKESGINDYNYMWSADDINIFKKVLIKFESNKKSVIDQEGGFDSKVLYAKNKQKYNILMTLNKSKTD